MPNVKPTGDQTAVDKQTSFLGSSEVDSPTSWVSGRSTNELVELLSVIAQELKRRSDAPTEVIGKSATTFDFPTVKGAVGDYQEMPLHSKGKSVDPWYIVLLSSNAEHEIMALKLTGDTVLGREVDGAEVDIDLAEFGGDRLGVSRHHALLRPTDEDLLLVDLGSTNGTFCNEQRAALGKPLPLKEGDTLRFAGLIFKLDSISRTPPHG